MSDTVHLSPAEAQALATRLVALRVADVDRWLDWEDLPHLDERSFALLVEEVEREAIHLHGRSLSLDRSSGIDSQWLQGRAEHGGER